MKNLSYQSNGSVWRLFITGSSEQEMQGRYFSLYNWNAVGGVDKVQDRIWACWTTPEKMFKYFTHINLFKMLDAAPNKFKGKKGGAMALAREMAELDMAELGIERYIVSESSYEYATGSSTAERPDEDFKSSLITYSLRPRD